MALGIYLTRTRIIETTVVRSFRRGARKEDRDTPLPHLSVRGRNCGAVKVRSGCLVDSGAVQPGFGVGDQG